MAKGKKLRGGRKTESVTVQKKAPKPQTVNCQPWSARNLVKKNLGGVIFACKKLTFKECFSKKLFGLPGAHIAYVQNVTPGMPLFLFNCSDRKLFGIFEAASSGQMNIDKYAWVMDESVTTPFPAQVRIKIRMLCHPLVEEQFKPAIINNYQHQDPNLFWFELDQNQTQKLISLLSNSPVSRSIPKPPLVPKWGNLLKKSVDDITRQESCSSNATSSRMLPGSSSTAMVKGKEAVEDQGNGTTYPQEKSWSSLFKTQAPLLEEEIKESVKEAEVFDKDKEAEESDEETEDSDTESLYSWPEEDAETSCVIDGSLGIPEGPPTVASSETSSSYEEASEEMSLEMNSEMSALFDKLLEAVGEIKEIQLTQTQKIESLDLELAEVNSRLQKLESHQSKSGSSSRSITDGCCDTILLVGGFNGSSWLQDLVSYLPYEDLIQPLVPMKSVRPYATAVELFGEVYVLGGGGHGASWFDTVESYNPRPREWLSRPALNSKKGNLSAAALLGKIYAVGGGNEKGCLSEVEVLDLSAGRWMVTRPMLSKRFSSAAAALNGAIYVAGGYDGQEYLSSVERYDPRTHSWIKLESLSTRRGCHSLAVLNEKLYAIGGYDGCKMVPTVEVFDPRVGSWTMSESLTSPRGYLGTVTLGNSIYALGGMLDNSEILDTVEFYSESHGWRLADSKFVGKRCFLSAVACNI